MEEMRAQEISFRFLGDDEFRALDVKQKALYLVRAQQELEERQRVMRLQLQDLAKKVG